MTREQLQGARAAVVGGGYGAGAKELSRYLGVETADPYTIPFLERLARFHDELARDTPYLDGDAPWQIYDNPTGEGAMLLEQINTKSALEKRAAPLTGPKPSLRRWMFFKFGHAGVMDKITQRLAALC